MRSQLGNAFIAMELTSLYHKVVGMNGEEKKLFGEQQRAMGRIEAQQENMDKKLDKVITFIDERAATKSEVNEIKTDVKQMKKKFEEKCVSKEEVGVIMKDHMQDYHDTEKKVGHAVIVNAKTIVLLAITFVGTYLGLDFFQYLPW